MARRIQFLLSVFFTLLATVIGVAWISKNFIFDKLEPAFLGALVAAAGATFAACIAYSAAIENVKLAQRAAEKAAADLAESERKRDEQELKRATKEHADICRLANFLDRMLKPFQNAQDMRGDQDYFDCYKDAERKGLIAPFLGSVREDLSTMTIDLMTRLVNLRQPISQAEVALLQTRDAPGFNRERERLSEGIKTIVAEAKVLRERVAGAAEIAYHYSMLLISVAGGKLAVAKRQGTN